MSCIISRIISLMDSELWPLMSGAPGPCGDVVGAGVVSVWASAGAIKNVKATPAAVNLLSNAIISSCVGSFCRWLSNPWRRSWFLAERF
jgi:hypothetical protein